MEDALTWLAEELPSLTSIETSILRSDLLQSSTERGPPKSWILASDPSARDLGHRETVARLRFRCARGRYHAQEQERQRVGYAKTFGTNEFASNLSVSQKSAAFTKSAIRIKSRDI